MINKKSFLINYIISLKERTRNEKGGTVIGFDWIMYNLFLAKGWTAIELPFIRSSEQSEFKTKINPQFGVDMAFIKNKELIVLVLKDEPLTYANWTKHNFQSDLSRAACPDPRIIEKEGIRSQRVILVYNKDEEPTGEEQYNRAVYVLRQNSLKNTSFERWNITKIVEEVETNLLTPELLPQHYSAQLSFMCQLIQRVEFGSKEWEQLLIPSWKLYLAQVLADKITPMHVNMFPISLVIIDQYRDRANPNSYLGFIELIEWSIIIAFNKVDANQKKEFENIWINLWGGLYLFELWSFLISNEKLFFVEHGLSRSSHLGVFAPLNDAYLIYWFIARISICFLGHNEIELKKDEDRAIMNQVLNKCRSWLKSLIRLNPGAYRPLLDINHIEIYLIWALLQDDDEHTFISEFFAGLRTNLVIRKYSKTRMPFIEGGNRLNLVAEFLLKPHLESRMIDFIDNSSYLILMVLELILSIHGTEKSELLEGYWREIVLGIDMDDKPLREGNKPLALQSIAPVIDWNKKIFSEDCHVETTFIFPIDVKIKDAEIQASILSFVKWSTNEFPTTFELKHPLGSYILACMKYKSPLPPYFWRKLIFPELYDKDEKK